jgi:DNA-binding MarR family transcriptional regulator
MGTPSTPPYRFGDLLALARQSWTQQMSTRLAERGYPDYRRSDAAAMRIIHAQPLSIGALGKALGVSRQAARKLTDSLISRRLATTSQHERDARSTLVSLTAHGRTFTREIEQVIASLNHELRAHVSAADLAATDRVLRAALVGDHARTMAERINPPDQRPSGRRSAMGIKIDRS